MLSPEAYFKEHQLYDKKRLQQHCEQNLVYMRESERFPTVVMLHYAEEAHFDKKWNQFNSMCRGLIVDMKNKRILAHPFNKFFNIDERPETKYSLLEKMGDFEVSEKLDGSLLILFKDPNTDKYFVTTKGSFDSEHGKYGTELIPERLKKDGVVEPFTLMFELISKKFQIVVDYEKKLYPEGLYLVGVRHRPTGELMSYSDVQEVARQYKLPTIKTYPFQSLDEIIEDVKQLPVLEEGYVIRFKSNGLMVKVKGTEYLRVHRFISRLSPKYILDALGEGRQDYLITVAPEEYRADVRATIKLFQNHRQRLVEDINNIFSMAPKNGSRKDFALWVNKHVVGDSKSFLFTLLDGKDLSIKKLYRIIGEREKVSSETTI